MAGQHGHSVCGRVISRSESLRDGVYHQSTKAENSSMQEMWQEIGESENICSRLLKFGMQALRSRECGLYEASDLLLGDHLLEKSESVVYIPVKMPHKRSRRLKNYSKLVRTSEHD